MTPSWRTLEREIADILRGHHFLIEREPASADMMLVVPEYDYQYQFKFSLTEFAKDLAKRLEQA